MPEGASELPSPHFLRLPQEMRLQILHYSITTGPITIVTTSGLSISPATRPINGLPASHQAVIKPGYSREALLTSIRGTQYGSSWPCSEADIKETQTAYPHTFGTLRAVCRTVHDDLATPLWQALGEGLDLHLGYPGGVCAVMDRWPWLIRQARKVSVYGVFDCRDITGETGKEDLASVQSQQIQTQVDVVKGMTSMVCGARWYSSRDSDHWRDQPPPEYMVRICYPYDREDDKTYGYLFSLPLIPSICVLQEVPAGQIGLYVYRGDKSAGIEISTQGGKTIPKERSITSRFPIMPNGRGQPSVECVEWAVDGGEKLKTTVR